MRVFHGKNLAPVVIATELDQDPGQTVTNAAQVLCPGIIIKYLPGWLDQAEDLVLLEHYPAAEGRGRRREDTLDPISCFRWKPWITHLAAGRFVSFGEPAWSTFGQERLSQRVRAIE